VTAPELDPAAVAAAMAAGELSVVDVREPVEWDAGHIAGSVLIPLGEFADRVAELPEGALAIVCRTGSRSSMAADWLHRSGVSASNMTGGLKAWAAAGLPLDPADGRVA
jgi:rhodanese-related sulfurtransferase